MLYHYQMIHDVQISLKVLSPLQSVTVLVAPVPVLIQRTLECTYQLPNNSRHYQSSSL